MTLAIALTHLLAGYAVLAAPWLGRVWYEKARRRIASGLPDAKVRLYRGLVVEQIITAVVLLAIWRSGRVPATRLGLVAPRWWAWNMVALLVIVGALAWSSLQLRPKAEKIRKRLQDSIGALLPDSHQERFWFGVVSVGAGISEELVFRGFLLYYFSLYVPQLNTLEKVLLASLVFGLAHIYQGWRCAVGAGILGLVFAGFYLATGSLLLPILIHAMVDIRALLIFPPNVSPAAALKGNA
jgi:membrane protease YdiL (CAAX protease family)